MNKFMQTRTALTHAYASFSALSRVIVLALAFVAGGADSRADAKC